MKLLRVSFQNINSLAGKWTIDFDSPEFTSEAFVVAGPTGAGKTSILDAISLAIYGRTARQKVTGGENAVMTEGTGSCFAEADFTDARGDRYRARWEQHRAYNKPEGALQSVTRRLQLVGAGGGELRDVSENTHEKTGEKTEVLVGLSFEQFVRAAILQQGAFDAFLKADTKERADILEKATRTEAFSAAGRKIYAAFKKAEKAKDRAEDNVGAMKQKADCIPEERAKAKFDLDAAEAASRVLASEIALLRKEENWSRDEDELVREEGALKEKMDEASARELAFEPLRPAYERAVSAREEFREKAHRELLSARNAEKAEEHRLELARREAASAAEALPVLGKARDEAEQRLEVVRQECVKRRAIVAEARQLDQQIAVAESEAFNADDRGNEAATLAAQAEKEAVNAERKAEEMESMLLEAAGWKPDEAIPVKWADTALFVALRKAAEAGMRIEEAAVKVARAEEAGKTAQAALEAAERHAEAARPGLEQAVAMAKANYETTEKFLSFADKRAMLKEGDICPLCGSEYHADGIPCDLPIKMAEAQESLDKAEEALRAEGEVVEKARQTERRAMTALDRARAEKEKVGADADRDRQNGPIALARATEHVESCRKNAQNLRAAATKAAADADVRRKESNDARRLCEELAARRKSLLGVTAAEEEKAVKTLEGGAEKALAKAERELGEAKARHESAQKVVALDEASLSKAEKAKLDADNAFVGTLAPEFLDEADWSSAKLADEVFHSQKAEHDSMATMKREIATLTGQLKERRGRHDGARPVENVRTVAELGILIGGKDKEKAEREAEKSRAWQTLLQLDELERTMGDALKDLARKTVVFEKWSSLNKWLGGKDGYAFRTYAQGLTLARLLAEANGPLLKMSGGRYELTWNPDDEDLRPDVVDHWQARERRTVSNLSGGEMFLVSLSLALGLGNLSGKDLSIETLFLDEGFGTLDDEKLSQALKALVDHRGGGCNIGIISHVEAVKNAGFDRIDVKPCGDGRSTISGPGVTGGPENAEGKSGKSAKNSRRKS